MTNEIKIQKLPVGSRFLFAMIAAGIVLASTHGAFSSEGRHPMALTDFTTKVQEDQHLAEDLPTLGGHSEKADTKTLRYVRDDDNKSTDRNPNRDMVS